MLNHYVQMTQANKLWFLKESEKRLKMDGKEIRIEVKILGNLRADS